MTGIELSIKLVVTLAMIKTVWINAMADQAIHDDKKMAWHTLKAYWLLWLGLTPLILFRSEEPVIWQDYVFSILLPYLFTRFLWFDIFRNAYMGVNIDYIGTTSRYDRFIKRVLMKQTPHGYLFLRFIIYFDIMGSWWVNYEPGKYWHTDTLSFWLFHGIVGTGIITIIVINLIKTRKNGPRNIY